jgi:hypothetical protein
MNIEITNEVCGIEKQTKKLHMEIKDYYSRVNYPPVSELIIIQQKLNKLIILTERMNTLRGVMINNFK